MEQLALLEVKRRFAKKQFGKDQYILDHYWLIATNELTYSMVTVSLVQEVLH